MSDPEVTEPSVPEPRPADAPAAGDGSPAPPEPTGRRAASPWVLAAIAALVLFNAWLYLPLLRNRGGPPPPASAPTLADDGVPPPGEAGPPPGKPHGPRPHPHPRPPHRPPGKVPSPPPPGHQGSEVPPPPGKVPSPPPPGQDSAVPPPPGAPSHSPPGRARGPLARFGATELQLGLLLLDRQPALRLTAAQRRRLLQDFRSVERPFGDSYAGVVALGAILTPAQRTYLENQRGPLHLREVKLSRPDQNPVVAASLQIARRQARSGEDTPLPTASPPSDSSAPHEELDLEDLTAAPLRLDKSSNLQLSQEQAARFVEALARLDVASRIEARLRREVEKTLRPDQLAFMAGARGRMEVMRRLVGLELLVRTLQAPAAKGQATPKG